MLATAGIADNSTTSRDILAAARRRPAVSDNRSLKKSKCTCEHTQNHQLLW